MAELKLRPPSQFRQEEFLELGYYRAGDFVAKEDFNFFAPGIVYSHQDDLDLTVEVAQDFLGRRMEAKGRRHQIEQRSFWRKLATLEVSEFLKLLPVLQPLDAQPVVQPLEWEVDFLMNLQLDHREPPSARRGQDIDDSAISSREGRNLRINMLG